MDQRGWSFFRGEPCAYAEPLLPAIWRCSPTWVVEDDSGITDIELDALSRFAADPPDDAQFQALVADRSSPPSPGGAGTWAHSPRGVDWIAAAQHYSTKTRFVDVTSNPLVALFFAATAHPEEDGLIYARPDDEMLTPLRQAALTPTALYAAGVPAADAR